MAALTAAQLNVRVLLALAVVILACRAAGWAMAKIGQPRVQGEILSGILLGPTLLGQLWPRASSYLFPDAVVDALVVLAQIGLVLFMFLIGLSFDLDELRGLGRKAVVISYASIIAPLVLGATLGLWLHPRFGDGAPRLGFVLFMGTAMAVTAFPVLARVLQETGLTHTRVGVLSITCAAVGDVTAWCVLAVVVAVVDSSGLRSITETVVMSVVFFIAMLYAVRPLLMKLPTVPLWLALCLALLAAWVTEEIGIHAIFGAFMAGAVLPRRAELQQQIHERLEQITVTFLLPVFFVVVGLSTRLDTLNSGYLWAVTALVIATAIAGKFGGSMAAAWAVGETPRDAAAIGVLMNTRGLTELVILTVGLELGVITPTMFTIMVMMALATTLMATPILAWISPDYRRVPADELPFPPPPAGLGEPTA